MDFHDYIHLGSLIVMGLVVIVTVKTDVRWIKQWCQEHKQDDATQFREVRDDIRQLREARK